MDRQVTLARSFSYQFPGVLLLPFFPQELMDTAHVTSLVETPQLLKVPFFEDPLELLAYKTGCFTH